MLRNPSFAFPISAAIDAPAAQSPLCYIH